jgi:hypothetical protein
VDNAYSNHLNDLEILQRIGIKHPSAVSSFYYGFVNGMTTITSRELTSKERDILLQRNEVNDGSYGWDLWNPSISRSLVRTEKERRADGYAKRRQTQQDPAP